MNGFLASIFTNQEQIIYEDYSELSGKIKVVEVDRIRELLINGVTHTIKNSNIINYWEISANLSNCSDNYSVLVLGLGGGEIPRILNKLYKNLTIDCVEIDEKIINIYNKFFKESDNVNIYHDDAYNYVMHTAKKYNIVYGDVYFKGLYDINLLENNFLEKVEKMLKPNGQFVSNRIFSEQPLLQGKEYESLLKIYFKNIYRKAIADAKFQTSNYVFFANKD